MASSFWFTDPTECLSLLEQRLVEPAPGRIQLLTGPRQVGKTTMLLRIAERLGAVATYVALDAPEAALPGFWDQLWSQAASTASRTGRAVLLLDEVQHLGNWSGRL